MAYAIEQPAGVEIGEVVIRPTAQDLYAEVTDAPLQLFL
jgi:hypothetical protein